MFGNNRNAGSSTQSKAARLAFNQMESEEKVMEEEEMVQDIPKGNPEISSASAPQESAKPKEEKTQNEEVVRSAKDELYQMVLDLGGPTKEQIEEMKKKLGRVHIVALDEDRLVIIRPLRRVEYRQLKTKQKEKNMENDDLELEVVQKCSVWPKLETTTYDVLEGGFVPSLYQSILDISLFKGENELAGITIKL